MTIPPVGDSGDPILPAAKPFESSNPSPTPISDPNDVGLAVPAQTETTQDQKPLEKPSAKVAQFTKTELSKPIKSASKDELGEFVSRTERLKPLRADNPSFDEPPPVGPSKEGLERAKEFRKRGNEEFGIHNYKEAVRLFLFAVLLDGSETSFGNRAVANFNAHNYRDAIEDFTKVINMNPRNAEAYYMRGLSYRRLEKPSQAEPDIARAVELDKTIVDRYRHLDRR